MNSPISWGILFFVCLYFGIRFAMRVINEYEAHQQEMRENEDW